MPLQKELCWLGESKQIIVKCLKSLNDRLMRAREFYFYNSFVGEYFKMEPIWEVKETMQNVINYVRPHCLFGFESSNTPVRLLIKASSFTSTRKSLNCLQYNGGAI